MKKKILTISSIICLVVILFAHSVFAWQGTLFYGNPQAPSVTGYNVSNQNVRCHFENTYGTWNHVELLDAGDNCVWDCWVSPNDNSVFWCGSNVKAIRFWSESPSYVNINW